MPELPSLRDERSLEQLEQLREDEDARDPAVRSARALFDLVAYYVVVWAGIGVLVILAVYPIEWIAKALDVPRTVATALGLLTALVIAIATFWSFDSEAGKKRERWLMRRARIYTVPIALLLAFYGGWYWRDRNPPDRYRADAERAAWKSCAQIPLCVQRATAANWGNDVLQYIREPATR